MKANRPILFIYNFLEDFLQFQKNVGEVDGPSENQMVSDFNQYYFLGIIGQFKKTRQQFYLYSACSIDQSYLQYLSKLLDVPRKNIHILFPKQIDFKTHLGNYCETILDDKETMEKLHDIDIVSYCNSDELFNLRDVLKGRANFIEAVSRECWDKMKRYGTKSGIRELIQSLNDEKIKMSKGQIFYNSQNSYNQAVSHLVQKLKTESAVIKIDKGFSGHGIVIIDKKQVQGLNDTQIQKYVISKMKQPYWKKLNIVIQNLIDIDYENPNGGSPYCMLNIDEKGEVEVRGILKMKIKQGKTFEGVQFGKDALNSQITKKIIYISQTIGKIYAKVGYRGYFDFDFLIDRNQNVFVSQSNVRRDGGTPIYTFAQSIFGKQLDKTHYFISYYFAEENLKTISFNKLLKQTEKNSLNFTKEKGGIVFTGVRPFKNGQLLYIAIGNTREEALQMSNKLMQICKNLK